MPGDVIDFLGNALLGVDMEFLPLGDSAAFCPFAGVAVTSVFSFGNASLANFSRDSGGDLAGKLMTCSRNGAE
jgi:hypothetical protein